MAEKAKQPIDAEKLTLNLGKDMAQIEKTAAKIKLPRDLRELDMTALLPSKTTAVLKEAVGQLREQAETVRSQQETEVTQQTVEVEKSIKVRQANLKAGLEYLRKAAPADNASVKTIETRVNETVKTYGRQIEDVQIRKPVKITVANIAEKKTARTVKPKLTP
ncbi:MAG: hypothetical protein PHV74_07890 [Dehalococcoidia bacterium]|nr:hypothetical protein [Dehalococcoidia bacterium]